MTFPSVLSGGFVSLKWKVVIVLSLVLLLINGLFPFLVAYHANHRLEHSRLDAQQRYQRQLDTVSFRAHHRLHQLGRALPEFVGLDGVADGDVSSAASGMAQYWPILQVNMGLAALAFYDAGGTQVGAWGELAERPVSAQLQAWVESQHEAVRTGRAFWECRVACLHYVLVPVVVDGRDWGTLLLGGALSDVIVAFQQVSGADVGVIVANEGAAAATKRGLMDLEAWNARLVALTHADHNMDLVSDAIRSFPALADARGRLGLDHGGRRYELNFVALPHISPATGLRLVIIDDISQPLAEVDAAIAQSIVAGVVGLLLSEAALLLLLWAPMSRLRKTARILPLLASSAYAEVRRNVGRMRRRCWGADEIDLLDRSAYRLSHQLEALERQVNERTRRLDENIRELSDERDFVQRLLDTAQVIIMTQNPEGEITSVNRYGQSLTGFDREELLGMRFERLAAGVYPELYRRQLAQVAVGDQVDLRVEWPIVGKSRVKRDIAWFHSHLRRKNDGAVMVLSVGIDVTERKEAESRIAWLANHDTLTGLINRRHLQERLAALLAPARGETRPGALLLIDLDQFKYINETSGHHAGDYLLEAVAGRLREWVDERYVLARLGGDEFAVLVPGAGAAEAGRVAEALQHALQALELLVDGQSHKVTASIGIALFPEHGEDAREILAHADLAMYHAKNSGRGRFHVFSSLDRSRQRLMEEVDWKCRIEQALSENRLVLVYQPILKLGDRRVSHYEVLVRMMGDGGELLRPGTFIEVAERSGLIRAIDHFVVRAAIAKLAELNQLGLSLCFSVNLSAHAFDDPELLPLLRDALADPQVDASQLIFEVTETAALGDIAAVGALMRAIKALGCRFSLDDFGVGFSSFHYLKQLPFDAIKIDGSFVRNLARNRADQILVKGLCAVGAGFGKSIVAECVEDEETLQLLLDYQVDMAQGHHIGRPSEILPVHSHMISSTP